MLTIGIKVILVMLIAGVIVSGQTRTFTRDDVEYKLDLPSTQWQVISRVDVHNHYEFINGSDPASGHLRLRKIVVDSATNAEELFRRDEKWELQRLPGYVLCGECSGECFEGALAGVVFAYEYVTSGRVMSGRIYYLQVDRHTFYALHFTVSSDKLVSIRTQMDMIARSFGIK